MREDKLKEFDKEIEEHKQERIQYSRSLSATKGLIKFKNPKDSEKLEKLLFKFTNNSTSLKDKENLYSKIVKLLKEEKRKTYLTSIEVKDILIANGVEKNFHLIDHIAKMISEDPAKGFQYYCRIYLTCVQNEQKEIKEKEEFLKKGSKDEEEYETSYTDASTFSSYGTPSTYSGRYHQEEVTKPKERIDGRKLSEEEKEERLNKLIKKVEDKKYYETLDFEDRVLLEEAYGFVEQPGEINRTFEMKFLEKKEDKNVKDITRYAVIVTKAIVNQITLKPGTNGRHFFDKMGIGNGLNNYINMYNKFMKDYLKLKPEEQKKVNRLIVNDSEYCRMFHVDANNPFVVTPKMIKEEINKRVILQVSNDLFYFDKEEDKMSQQLSSVTKYMEIDDMIELYRRVKYERETRRYNYAKTEEEKETIAKNNEEYDKNLQTLIAKEIVHKLTEYNKKYTNLSEKEKEEVIEERNQQMAAIIIQLLHETPKDKIIRESAQGLDLSVDIAEGLIKSHGAKKTARERVYNMSKLERAFTKITGKWSKYASLMDKDILDEQDQEKLQSVVRGM